jgi:hypothetical protein
MTVVCVYFTKVSILLRADRQGRVSVHVHAAVALTKPSHTRFWLASVQKVKHVTVQVPTLATDHVSPATWASNPTACRQLKHMLDPLHEHDAFSDCTRGSTGAIQTSAVAYQGEAAACRYVQLSCHVYVHMSEKRTTDFACAGQASAAKVPVPPCPTARLRCFAARGADTRGDVLLVVGTAKFLVTDRVEHLGHGRWAASEAIFATLNTHGGSCMEVRYHTGRGPLRYLAYAVEPQRREGRNAPRSQVSWAPHCVAESPVVQHRWPKEPQ